MQEIRISNGWVYINFPHKWASPYRNKFRLPNKPEVIVSLFEENPELKDKYNDLWLYNSKWVERLSRSHKIKQMDGFKFSYDFKMPPMRHQEISLAFALNIPSSALFLEQGTGKTYVALLTASMRYDYGRIKKPLVIAPASVLQTGWEADCRKFTDFNPIILSTSTKMKSWFCPLCENVYTSITDSHAKSHFRELRELLDEPKLKRKDTTHEHYLSVFPEAIEVLHENDFLRETDISDRIKINEGKNLWIISPDLVTSYRDELIAAGFDKIILDESTMIKSPSSARTKAVIKLGDTARYKMILSGTPITNHLEDIWSQMRFLDCSLGSSYTAFQNKYFNQSPHNRFVIFPKRDSADKIQEVIKDRCIRLTKKECLDLPPRTFLFREVDMSSTAKKHYKTMLDELFAVVDSEEVVASTVMNKVQRLQQITNGFLIGEDGQIIEIDKKTPKLKETLSILEEMAPEQKAIIWCVYRHDKAVLMENLKEYNPVILTTSTIMEGIEKFKTDDTCRVAIANPKSCKFGLTLNNSNVTIYYSMSYSVEDYLQSLDRNHRNGQTLPVTVYHIIGSSIDQMIYDTVNKNVDFGQKIVNNKAFKAKMLS